MNGAPNYVRIDCDEPECKFYVDGHAGSGFGEHAAELLDEHCQAAHGTRFPRWKQ